MRSTDFTQFVIWKFLFFLNFRFSIIYVFLATALYDLCKQNIQFIEKIDIIIYMFKEH